MLFQQSLEDAGMNGKRLMLEPLWSWLSELLNAQFATSLKLEETGQTE